MSQQRPQDRVKKPGRQEVPHRGAVIVKVVIGPRWQISGIFTALEEEILCNDGRMMLGVDKAPKATWVECPSGDCSAFVDSTYLRRSYPVSCWVCTTVYIQSTERDWP